MNARTTCANCGHRASRHGYVNGWAGGDSRQCEANVPANEGAGYDRCDCFCFVGDD